MLPPPHRRPRPFRLVVGLAAVAALGCWIGWQVGWEQATASWKQTLARRSKELAEHAGQLRQAHEAAQDARDDALASAREAEAESEALAASVARLERELAHALERERRIADLIEGERERLEARHRAFERRWERAMRPMPEGVRRTLVRVNQQLRLDGHGALRFLRAETLDPAEHVLTGVELLEHDPEQLTTTVHLAGRLQIELDRASGSLVLRMFDGRTIHSGAEDSEHPDEGAELRLLGVEGPDWEAGFPALVRATGAYPPEQLDGDPATVPRMDPVSASAWRARVQTLLQEAELDKSYRLASFRALEDGAFVDATVLGYGEGRRLEIGFEADRLAVEIDREAGLVALWMAGGRIRRGASDGALPETGYRLTLTGVGPDRALEVMLGMVATR